MDFIFQCSYFLLKNYRLVVCCKKKKKTIAIWNMWTTNYFLYLYMRKDRKDRILCDKNDDIFTSMNLNRKHFSIDLKLLHLFSFFIKYEDFCFWVQFTLEIKIVWNISNTLGICILYFYFTSVWKVKNHADFVYYGMSGNNMFFFFLREIKIYITMSVNQ